jgi:hypothetical protein
MSDSIEGKIIVVAGVNGWLGEASARPGADMRPAGNRR